MPVNNTQPMDYEYQLCLSSYLHSMRVDLWVNYREERHASQQIVSCCSNKNSRNYFTLKSPPNHVYRPGGGISRASHTMVPMLY